MELPAKEKPSQDCIDREEAIRIAEQGQIQGFEWQFKKLCDLPPVTTEPFINKPCISEGVCREDKIQVLDKIRAEIMQLDYDLESVDYDYNDMTMTEEIHTICREEVLQIIDKYKAESEVKADDE